MGVKGGTEWTGFGWREGTVLGGVGRPGGKVSLSIGMVRVKREKDEGEFLNLHYRRVRKKSGRKVQKVQISGVFHSISAGF